MEGHIPRRETHHVHNGNLCALKWGVASVGRNAYQSIYMTLQPWADAVRRRMGTFERGDVLEIVYGVGSTPGAARLVSYVRAGDKTFYALTEQGGLRQFRYEKVKRRHSWMVLSSLRLCSPAYPLPFRAPT